MIDTYFPERKKREKISYTTVANKLSSNLYACSLVTHAVQQYFLLQYRKTWTYLFIDNLTAKEGFARVTSEHSVVVIGGSVATNFAQFFDWFTKLIGHRSFDRFQQGQAIRSAISKNNPRLLWLKRTNSRSEFHFENSRKTIKNG